jgi:arsenate reductase (thioredoxin)
MTDKTFNVLFLCTGNSARSILAEALVTIMSHGVLKGYSAGSHPRGLVHPIAQKLVLDLKYPKENLRSKSWNEYSHPNAPHMDFIITVCDNAKGEVCSIWPGHPATLHWGLPDPALVSGPYEEQEKAFKEVKDQLKEKIENLINIVRYMR